MLLLLSVVLGILAGMLKKGKLSRLVRLKLLWLSILSFAATAILSLFPQAAPVPKALLLCLSYLCVFAFCFANRRFAAGSALFGLGSLCNFTVISANGFRMPVAESALEFYPDMTAEAVLERSADYFVAVGGQAKLLFLGDIICVPLPYFGGFISVGDIILAIGMFILILSSMTRSEGEKTSR